MNMDEHVLDEMDEKARAELRKHLKRANDYVARMKAESPGPFGTGFGSIESLAGEFAAAAAAEVADELERWREREAACCPEDVSFDEYIRHLETKAAGLEEQLRAAGDALALYGRHHGSCPASDRLLEPCNCGLREIILGLPSEKAHQEEKDEEARERVSDELAGSRCGPACGWCGRCS